MPRPSSTVSMPTRKIPAPALHRGSTTVTMGSRSSRSKSASPIFRAADDPLDALATEVLATNARFQKPTYAQCSPQGKPIGGVEVFGSRRAPARRAAFRQPPR